MVNLVIDPDYLRLVGWLASGECLQLPLRLSRIAVHPLLPEFRRLGLEALLDDWQN